MLCIDLNSLVFPNMPCVLTDVCVSRVIVANLSSASIVAIALVRAHTVASCLPSWGFRCGIKTVKCEVLWIVIERSTVVSSCKATTRAPRVSRWESPAAAGLRRGHRGTGVSKDVRRFYVLQKCADSTQHSLHRK